MFKVFLSVCLVMFARHARDCYLHPLLIRCQCIFRLFPWCYNFIDSLYILLFYCWQISSIAYILIYVKLYFIGNPVTFFRYTKYLPTTFLIITSYITELPSEINCLRTKEGNIFFKCWPLVRISLSWFILKRLLFHPQFWKIISLGRQFQGDKYFFITLRYCSIITYLPLFFWKLAVILILPPLNIIWLYFLLASLKIVSYSLIFIHYTMKWLWFHFYLCCMLFVMLFEFVAWYHLSVWEILSHGLPEYWSFTTFYSHLGLQFTFL